MKYSALEFAKQLIAFESITPYQAGCIDFIENLLKGNGFNTYKYEFGGDEKGGGEKLTTNLYAVRGETGPNLCFAGHIDVVPPGDLSQWKYPPFSPTIENDVLYGRGAVDMKGAIAAGLAAALNYKNADFKISFLLTSDEEASGEFGTNLLLKKIYSEGHKIDFAIVGEPTCESQIGDMIKIGRRGSINFELRVNGIQGHVAYPTLAQNPHNNLIKILTKLIDYRFDEGNQYFDPSNLEITSINTDNNVTNLIPASSNVCFNIRYNNEYSDEEIINKIKMIIESITFNYSLKYKSSAKPFLSKITEFKKEFAKNVFEVTGIEPIFSTTGGTSDARFIKDYTDFLEFGLLNLSAHKIDESCKISDLQMLYNVYYKAIEKFNNSNI